MLAKVFVYKASVTRRFPLRTEPNIGTFPLVIVVAPILPSDGGEEYELKVLQRKFDGDEEVIGLEWRP